MAHKAPSVITCKAAVVWELGGPVVLEEIKADPPKASEVVKFTSQVTSQQVKAIALYSASADDLDTTACFLDFHEIVESPRRMQYPVVDLLVMGQLAQSESQYAFSSTAELLAKRIPCPESLEGIH
ncbi:alcohol dehydrogenase 1 [Tanacetum coccineum]